MFTENSGLVKTWVNLIKRSSIYKEKDVPAISNLREMVHVVLMKGGDV